MDKKNDKSKGYGFISFADPTDYLRVMKEMQGQYVGNRPLMLKKSNWKSRLDVEKIEEERANQDKKSNEKQKFSRKLAPALM